MDHTLHNLTWGFPLNILPVTVMLRIIHGWKGFTKNLVSFSYFQQSTVSKWQLVFRNQAFHVGVPNRPPWYCNNVQVFKEVLLCLIIGYLEKTIFDFVTLSKIVPKDRNIKLKTNHQSLQYLDVFWEHPCSTAFSLLDTLLCHAQCTQECMPSILEFWPTFSK